MVLERFAVHATCFPQLILQSISYLLQDLKVSVLKKVDTESSTASQWFPKKVVIVTDKRRMESMAWAHSSSDLMGCSSSTEISCPIENDSRADLSMDSDPSLSSINAPSWYSSQNPSMPSTSSASTTSSFQLSSIEIEPDIDAGSMRSHSPPLETENGEVAEKGCTSILKTRTALRKPASSGGGPRKVQRTRSAKHLLRALRKIFRRANEAQPAHADTYRRKVFPVCHEPGLMVECVPIMSATDGIGPECSITSAIRLDCRCRIVANRDANLPNLNRPNVKNPTSAKYVSMPSHIRTTYVFTSQGDTRKKV
ncbi:hypothetical protein OSTOST_04984 [Ostertagia ostertagi]